MTTTPIQTITDMTSGSRTASASAFLDAVTDAALAPSDATVDIEIFDRTAFAAHVTLPHADDRKLERLHRWLDLLPRPVEFIRGQCDETDDIVRLNIRALSGRRMVIITAEFSRKDEPGAIALITSELDRVTPALLAAFLLADRLVSTRPAATTPPRPLMPPVRARITTALARSTDSANPRRPDPASTPTD
jgi:hypothetical protein